MNAVEKLNTGKSADENGTGGWCYWYFVLVEVDIM
jgi:hypothetical protein